MNFLKCKFSRSEYVDKFSILVSNLRILPQRHNKKYIFLLNKKSS